MKFEIIEWQGRKALQVSAESPKDGYDLHQLCSDMIAAGAPVIGNASDAETAIVVVFPTPAEWAESLAKRQGASSTPIEPDDPMQESIARQIEGGR